MKTEVFVFDNPGEVNGTGAPLLIEDLANVTLFFPDTTAFDAGAVTLEASLDGENWIGIRSFGAGNVQTAAYLDSFGNLIASDSVIRFVRLRASGFADGVMVPDDFRITLVGRNVRTD